MFTTLLKMRLSPLLLLITLSTSLTATSNTLEQPYLWWSVRPQYAKASLDGSTFGVFVDNREIAFKFGVSFENVDVPLVITPAFWRRITLTISSEGQALPIERSFAETVRVIGSDVREEDPDNEITLHPGQRLETDMIVRGPSLKPGDTLAVVVELSGNGIKHETGNNWEGRFESRDQFSIVVRGLRTPEDRGDYQSARGAAALQRGAYAEAAAAFRAALAATPDDQSALAGLGHALVRSREYRDAVPVLERVLSMVKGMRSPVPYLLAEAYVGIGDIPRATQVLSRVMPPDQAIAQVEKLRQSTPRR